MYRKLHRHRLSLCAVAHIALDDLEMSEYRDLQRVQSEAEHCRRHQRGDLIAVGAPAAGSNGTSITSLRVRYI